MLSINEKFEHIENDNENQKNTLLNNDENFFIVNKSFFSFYRLIIFNSTTITTFSQIFNFYNYEITFKILKVIITTTI